MRSAAKENYKYWFRNLLLSGHPEQERNTAPFLALMIHEAAYIQPLISPGPKVA